MKSHFVFLFLIAVAVCQTLDKLPGVPPEIVEQANQSLRKATPQLENFTLKKYNKILLHRVVKTALSKLYLIKEALKTNNLILGDNNGVKGQGNIIIGSDNNINGNNNWLISVNKYQGDAEQTLIYKDWEIKMNYVDLILIKPNLVIRVLNEDEKNNFLIFFNKLKNVENGLGVCNLFWGISDKENKLLLTANRIVQYKKHQAQMTKFASENELLQNGKKIMIFQGFNTKKILSSLGLLTPSYIIKSEQKNTSNKDNETNSNNQNKSIQNKNSSNNTQSDMFAQKVENIYSSGVKVYNNIQQKINQNPIIKSCNRNSTAENKQLQSNLINRFRNFI